MNFCASIWKVHFDFRPSAFWAIRPVLSRLVVLFLLHYTCLEFNSGSLVTCEQNQHFSLAQTYLHVDFFIYRPFPRNGTIQSKKEWAFWKLLILIFKYFSELVVAMCVPTKYVTVPISPYTNKHYFSESLLIWDREEVLLFIYLFIFLRFIFWF